MAIMMGSESEDAGSPPASPLTVDHHDHHDHQAGRPMPVNLASTTPPAKPLAFSIANILSKPPDDHHHDHKRDPGKLGTH